MSSERGRARASLAFLFAGSLAAAGCADFSRGEPTPGVDAMAAEGGPGGVSGDGGGPSFAASAYPVLMDGCARCHAAGGEASNTSFLVGTTAAATYASAVKLVTVADPSASRLLAKAAGRGHTGGAIYAAGSAGYETILGWIAGGALP